MAKFCRGVDERRRENLVQDHCSGSLCSKHSLGRREMRPVAQPVELQRRVPQGLSRGRSQALPLSIIKIVRNPKDKDGKPAEAAFLRIVAGTDQSLEHAPTQTTTSLLPMLRACEDSSAGIQMAPMSKIRHSAQYALAVEHTDGRLHVGKELRRPNRMMLAQRKVMAPPRMRACSAASLPKTHE